MISPYIELPKMIVEGEGKKRDKTGVVIAPKSLKIEVLDDFVVDDILLVIEMEGAIKGVGINKRAEENY